MAPVCRKNSFRAFLNRFIVEMLRAQNPVQAAGLGLAVVKKSMQQMGGNVRAENAPGGGLRIVMQLPMAKEG